MRIFSETAKRNNISIFRDIPTHIEYSSGAPATAHFSNGESSLLGCIGCTNPQCMRFTPNEIMCDEVKNFPNDQGLNVCAVDAMYWDYKTDTPVVDTEKCINCGVCIRRCPVGAIYFDKTIKVNKTVTDKQIRGSADSATSDLQTQQIEELYNVRRSGVLIAESDDLLKSIYEKLSNIRSSYHNPIARNLLISLGCKSATRRIGDVYTRMDAVYSAADGSFGAVEVEFGRDTLDASRGILDDIAVLFTRYGIEKTTNLPLVICLQLPNVRQGYWQVVKDVKAVEEITIGTLTIGAMLLLNWNGCLLMPDDVTYYLDYDNMDLRSVISWQIGREIRISDRFLGILEPVK